MHISATISLKTLAATYFDNCAGSLVVLAFSSTMSAPTISGARTRCSRVNRSLVDIPPGSLCETPGQNAGSSTSRSTEMYLVVRGVI